MRTMDRRAFLRGAFLAERGGNPVPPEPSRPAAAPAARAAPADGNGSRVGIGILPDFPVGEVRRLERLGIEIESRPEGLRARSLYRPGRYHAITAGPAGTLFAHQDQAWPAGRVFSVLINGPADLDTTLEEDA